MFYFWKCWLTCAKLSEALVFLCFRSQSSAVAAASENRSGAEVRNANKCHKLPYVGGPEHNLCSWMMSQVSQLINHCLCACMSPMIQTFCVTLQVRTIPVLMSCLCLLGFFQAVNQVTDPVGPLGKITLVRNRDMWQTVENRLTL